MVAKESSTSGAAHTADIPLSPKPSLMVPLTFAIVMAWFLGIVSWAWFNHLGAHHRFDFVQDYFAARNLRIGHSLYENPQELFPGELAGLSGGQVVNNHPPSSAIWYLPCSFLPYHTAFMAWSCLNTVLYLTVVWMLLSEWKLSAAVRLLGVGAALVWNPWSAQLMMGQNSALQLFLIFLGWRSIDRGTDLLSGILFGLATTLKLFPGLLVFYFLVRRRPYGVLGMLLAVLLWTGTATLMGVRLSEWVTYQQEIVPAQLARWVNTPPNQSIAGLSGAVALVVDAPAAGKIMAGFTGAILAALLFGVLLRHKEQAEPQRDLTLLLLTALLLSPICWSHYVLTLLPSLAWMWRRVLPLGFKNPQCIIVLLGTILLSWPDLDGKAAAQSMVLANKLPCIGMFLLLGILIIKRQPWDRLNAGTAHFAQSSVP